MNLEIRDRFRLILKSAPDTDSEKILKSLELHKSKNILSMNMSNCDGFGLIHRVIKLVEATNLEHGSQDGADGGDTELNGGGGSEMENLRYVCSNCT